MNRGHDIPAARDVRATLAIGLVLVVLWLSVPAQAAGRGPRGDEGWAARPLRAAGPPGVARPLRASGLSSAAVRLVASLPSGTRVGLHPSTGRVRFLAAPRRASLMAPPEGHDALASESVRPPGIAVAERAARGFMRRFGQLFGLARPDRELLVAGTTASEAPRRGRELVVRLRQERRGVPVLGGEVAVRVGPTGEVLAAAGELLPAASRVDVRPRIGRAAATAIARRWAAREVGRAAGGLAMRSLGLAIHDPRIMGDEAQMAAPGGSARLVWRIDARLLPGHRDRSFHRHVLVDARNGRVVTTLQQLARLDRRICDFRNVPRSSERCSSPYARREGDPATGIGEVDAAYRLLGVANTFYRTVLGRDGTDGEGAPMVAAVRFCPRTICPMQGAFWSWHLQQSTYGRGWVADDILGHEVTHGIVEHTAGLFYHYQSGAINESMADVFGEIIDLREPTGRDTAWTRWKIGEDTPPGVLRDMRDPTRYGDPDRIRSWRWRTGSQDDGGVHANSGVGNKAAFLMAQGGSFNDRTVSGIGLERTARIWYRALSVYLTAASDYIDLGDALLQSCVDLAGSAGITLAHCASVRAATRATQMHLRPRAGPRAARVCASGRYPVDAFHDDMEDPAAGLWRQERLAGDVRVWYYPPNPNNDPEWDATWASSGELNLYGADRGQRSDAVMTLTSGVVLPDGARLWFAHGYGFDTGRHRYDGGVVEVSLDGGRWRDLGSRFTRGGYNGRIHSGTGNRLGGRRAFTARSRGHGSSKADLSGWAGRTARLRFRLASDRSGRGLGWYIDDVRIYRCADDEERPTGSLTIDDGAATTTGPMVTLRIDARDDASGVVRMLVSNSDEMDGVRLARGLLMDPRGSLEWSLTEAAWGGTNAVGTKRVHVQVRDAAGRWSRVFSDDIELLSAIEVVDRGGTRRSGSGP